MSCSWNLKLLTLVRCGLIAAFLIAGLAVPIDAEAQGAYCQDFADTLLSHSTYPDHLRCVSSPSRDRALNVETFSWNGGVYMIYNRGNELEIYDIGGSDATNPDKIDGSRFNFGNDTDSDYDLVTFDVCDGCRFGVLDHKARGVVVFDLGTASEPDFGSFSQSLRQVLRSKVFKHDNQEYLIAGGLTENCDNHALFAIDGVNDLVELQCMEANGKSIGVSGGAEVRKGSTTYLYLGTGLVGEAQLFKTTGSGYGLRLEHLGSPNEMVAMNHNLAINRVHNLVVSADRRDGKVRFWDISDDPGDPQLKSSWTLDANASAVALGSASSSSPLVMWTGAVSYLNSSQTYLIDPVSGPQPFDNDFWGDLNEPHNEYQDCVLDQDGALSPDGSTLYLTRFALHQVFDLSACMGPTEAVAGITVAPTSVFPGETVTIRDLSAGSYDAWALWVDRDGVFEDGETLPSPSNPTEMTFTVPQNVAEGEAFTANILISNTGLEPAIPEASEPIGIDRSPVAGYTVTPETAVVGETVTLSALAEANPSDVDAYVWTIDPPQAVPYTDSGATVDVDLDVSGDWKFTLTVNYDHGASGISQDSEAPYDYRWGDLDDDGAYEYESSREYPVSSVAADFTITSDSQTGDLLNNSALTLDGGESKGSIELYEWTVFGPKDRAADCDAAPPGDDSACAMERDICPDQSVCIIPAETLAWGSYDFTLLVSDGGSETSEYTKPNINILNGEIRPLIVFPGGTLERGENLIFRIEGVEVPIDKATWTMGGAGCDGASSTQVCTAGLFDDCKAISFEYSSSGQKVVGVEIEIGNTDYSDTRPASERTITIASSGSCSTGGGGGGGGGGGTTCTYTHSDTGIAPGPAAAEFAFTVLTSFGCSWSATTSSSWINILSPSGTDSGTGTVRFAVQQNFGPARTGFISAGGRSYRVDQGAPFVAANFTMSNPFPERGEVVTFSVDPILVVESWNFGEENCDGDSPQVSCLFLPPGACNSIEWAFQTEGQKSVTMVLADDRTQTKNPVVQSKGQCCFADGSPDASFTVNDDQIYTGELVSFTDTSSKSAKNAKALGFTWTPPDPEIGDSITFRLEGINDDVAEANWNFGETGCNGASATEQCTPSLFNDCAAVTFKYASGGPKNVSVTVGLAGGGSVSAGPTTVNVASTGSCETGGGGGGGTGCSWSISPTSVNFYETGGVGTVNVTTSPDCPWDATTTSSWIDITNGSGTGSGVVSYNVQQNTSESSRTGLVKIENKTHTVRQNGVDPVLDTAPTAWLWTVSRFLADDSFEVVHTSTEQHLAYVFDQPGSYRVALEASNCYGSANYSQSYEVLQAPVEDYVVGAAVSMAGDENTQWETDLRFFNPCGELLDVKVSYEPGGTNNTGVQLLSREFDLNANETRVFSDVVDVIPGLADQELSGSVRIESESASGCKVMTVSRTFNDTPNGSLGLNVPALPVKRSEFDRLGFTGLIRNQDYRTNVRLVNYGDEDTWVGLSMYDKQGNPVGTPIEYAPVAGHSTFQINDVAAFLKYEGDIDLFSVKADVGGRDLDAFATVIDRLTGDSVLRRSSYTGESKIWLVGVANLEGANESRWKTDVWLYNPFELGSETWLGGHGKFVAGDSSGDAFGFEWPLLPPGSSQRYIDVLSSVLGLDDRRGYMVLEGAPGLPMPQVAARTYNLDVDGGTSGLGLHAFSESDLLYPGETGYVVGISTSQDKETGFRTNLGVVNTDDTLWAEVKITIFGTNSAPVPLQWTVSIGPGVYYQWDIFKALGLDSVTMTGSIKIEVLDGGGLAVFATEIDNRTQDSIFLPAQRKYIGLAP